MSKSRSALATALEVPRWALSIYARHAAWIVGLSLIPSAQRAVGQLWGDQLPGAVNAGLELLTAGVRFLLVVLLVRVAFLSDRRIRALGGDAAWRRVVSFVRTRWPSLLIQIALVGAMALVFEVVPDQVIGPRVPAASESLYWAVLLAVKNPTVIAFTIVWQLGAVRQMLLTPAAGETDADEVATDEGAGQRQPEPATSGR